MHTYSILITNITLHYINMRKRKSERIMNDKEGEWKMKKMK